MSDEVEWKPIESAPKYRTVLVYRAGDLFPVVACLAGRDFWTIEEGGPEDGTHRQYPAMAYLPTHWAPLPKTPEGA